MGHFLPFFTVRMCSHLFICVAPAQQRDNSLMNYLPSTAARHPSATTISATSTSVWEVRKRGTQRVSDLLFAQGQETEALCAWPAAALPVEQHLSVGTSSLVKAASDGCCSSFLATKVLLQIIVRVFFSVGWVGCAVSPHQTISYKTLWVCTYPLKSSAHSSLLLCSPQLIILSLCGSKHLQGELTNTCMLGQFQKECSSPAIFSHTCRGTEVPLSKMKLRLQVSHPDECKADTTELQFPSFSLLLCCLSGCCFFHSHRSLQVSAHKHALGTPFFTPHPTL